MTKYKITVHGCDDSTGITHILLDEEYELLKEIADKITKASTYGCMPTMEIELEEDEELNQNNELGDLDWSEE